MYTEAFPIYTTPDLERALGFYRDLLGGVISYRFPADGPPVYVNVRWGSTEVGLGQGPAPGRAGRARNASDEGGQPGSGADISDPAAAPQSPARPVALCVYANDCDAAVAALRAAGVVVLEEPVDQPWGERMARVADPDGNPVIIMSR